MSVQSRCDGSDGKAKDSGLNGSEFNPRPRQDNFSCFLLVALEPLRSASKYVFAVLLQKHVTMVMEMERKVLYPLSLRYVQVPVTIQETAD